MKKVIVLFLMIFVISGCDVEYQLNIDEITSYTYSENVNFISKNSEESQNAESESWPIPSFFDSKVTSEVPEKVPGVKYYTQESYFEKNYNHLRFKYDFNSYDFFRANSVRICYQSFYKLYDDINDTTNLKTSNEFLCYTKYPIIENVTIRINVTNPVKEHNADNVNGQTYEWVINQNNYKNKSIQLSYEGGFTDEPKKQPVNKKEDVKDDSTNFFIAVGVIGVFFLSIIGIIVYNVRKQNVR